MVFSSCCFVPAVGPSVQFSNGVTGVDGCTEEACVKFGGSIPAATPPNLPALVVVGLCLSNQSFQMKPFCSQYGGATLVLKHLAEFFRRPCGGVIHSVTGGWVYCGGVCEVWASLGRGRAKRKLGGPFGFVQKFPAQRVKRFRVVI